jgi:dTDP-4-amino-4,6-dideoxygalactose transaminase
MKNIKFSKTNIVDKDIKLVGKIIKSGWLTHGKFTANFENQFKKYTNSKYAISVSSCTAGLHLSCLASGFKKGDEIIVPAQTHTATAHAVEYTGARAIFADVDILTGNISLESIKKNITKKTKGVIIVHMAGYPC